MSMFNTCILFTYNATQKKKKDYVWMIYQIEQLTNWSKVRAYLGTLAKEKKSVRPKSRVITKMNWVTRFDIIQIE